MGQWALSWAPWPVWCHTKRAGSQSSMQTDTHTDSLPRSPCSLISYSEPKTSWWRKTQIPNIHPAHSPCFVRNPIINFTDSVKNNQVRRFNEEDWPLVRRTGAETGRAGQSESWAAGDAAGDAAPALDTLPARLAHTLLTGLFCPPAHLQAESGKSSFRPSGSKTHFHSFLLLDSLIIHSARNNFCSSQKINSSLYHTQE